jgi:DNA mismatch repair protein MutS
MTALSSSLKKKSTQITPTMVQWFAEKEAHPDCLLFFQLGDFFELFFDDAQVVAKALNLTLTKRGLHQGEPIPMCGVPVHAAQNYLARLLKAGHKVALCEQVETPAKKVSCGPLERQVTRILTPGTLTDEGLLLDTGHNFLVCVFPKNPEGASGHVAGIDISTGHFFVESFIGSPLDTRLFAWGVSEVLIPFEYLKLPSLQELVGRFEACLTTWPLSRFHFESSSRKLRNLWEVHTLETLGLKDESQVVAVSTLLDYLTLTQKGSVASVTKPRLIETYDYVRLDPSTYKNLEIFETTTGKKEGSLLHTLDQTCSAGGKRLLKERFVFPSKDLKVLEARLDCVSHFVEHVELRDHVRNTLSGLPDLERALTRVSLGRALPRDLGYVRDSLRAVQELRKILAPTDLLSSIPQKLADHTQDLIPHADLLNFLDAALKDVPPNHLTPDDFAQEGFDPLWDKFAQQDTQCHQDCQVLEDQLRTNLSIPTLKVKSNNLVGFFIEVTAKYRNCIPTDFQLKQSLSNTLRYTMPQLQQLEMSQLQAAQQKRERELKILHDLFERTSQHQDTLFHVAKVLSEIDVDTALAHQAVNHNYRRPTFSEDPRCFDVQEGRHPVVETLCNQDYAPFTPNNCVMNEKSTFMLLTGANMAGKSTFLRQNALITLMAHAGCFVPARTVTLGLTDQIFSRVGASDNLNQGESTFMVEMLETAYILNHATEQSFVILDEVGRGTSVDEGCAIARAVIRYLLDTLKCRTLFATHYYDLADMHALYPTLKPYTFRVETYGEKIFFRHQVIPGKASQAYALEVAKRAGIPASVIQDAKKQLKHLTSSSNKDASNA